MALAASSAGPRQRFCYGCIPRSLLLALICTLLTTHLTATSTTRSSSASSHSSFNSISVSSSSSIGGSSSHSSDSTSVGSSTVSISGSSGSSSSSSSSSSGRSSSSSVGSRSGGSSSSSISSSSSRSSSTTSTGTTSSTTSSSNSKIHNSIIRHSQPSFRRRLRQYDDWLWDPQSSGMGSLRQKGLPARAMPPSPPAAPPPPSPAPLNQYTWAQVSEPYNMDGDGAFAVAPGQWTDELAKYWSVSRTVNPMNAFAQAAFPDTEGALLLAESIPGEQSITAVLDSPFDSRTGFSAHFTFRVDYANGTLDGNNSAVGGQGLTFALFRALPGVNGNPGAGLGYGGIDKSLAIEMDFQFNDFRRKDKKTDSVNTQTADGLLGAVGPDANHIGINLNGEMVSAKVVHINSPMANAQDKNVWVVYSGDAQKTLQVFFSDTDTELPPYPILTYDAASVSSILGNSNGDVFFGFTASSSIDAMGDISIVQANFTQYPIVDIAPDWPPTEQGIAPEIWSDSSNAFVKLDPPEGQLTDVFARSSAVIRPSALGMIMTNMSMKNKGSQSTVATYLEPLNCSVGCSVFFTYSIVNDDNAALDEDLRYGGDGLSFIFLPQADYISDTNKPGLLGYGGLKGTVAVELDTFYNEGVDPVNPVSPDGTMQYIGTDGDHIGINLDGSTESEVTWHAITSLNSPGVKFVWVEYIGGTRTLQVFYNPFSADKPLSPVISYLFDLKDFFNGVLVYPAFGAGYSIGVSNHFIKNVTFRSYDGLASSGMRLGPVDATGVQFKSFSPNVLALWNTTGLTRKPPADNPVTLPSADGSLPLSTYSRDAFGNIVTLTKSIDLSYGFEVSFSFIVEPQNYTAAQRAKLGDELDADPADLSTGGEGFTFVVVNSPEVKAGGADGGLGYSGIPDSLAVEFDTYYTFPDDPTGADSQTNGNHIGIDWNGNINSKAVAALRGDGTKIDDDTVKYAWIEYSSAQKIMQVYFSNSANKPADAILTQTDVNLADLIKSKTAYFGFTGESTANTWVQKVLSLDIKLKSADSAPITVLGPPSLAPRAPPAKRHKSGLTWRGILLIVVATVLVVLALLGLCVFLIWRRTKKREQDPYKLGDVTAQPTIITAMPIGPAAPRQDSRGYGRSMRDQQPINRALPFTKPPGPSPQQPTSTPSRSISAPARDPDHPYPTPSSEMYLRSSRVHSSPPGPQTSPIQLSPMRPSPVGPSPAGRSPAGPSPPGPSTIGRSPTGLGGQGVGPWPGKGFSPGGPRITSTQSREAPPTRERDASRDRDGSRRPAKEPEKDRSASKGKERSSSRGRSLLDLPKHLRVSTKKKDKTPTSDLPRPAKAASPPSQQQRPWIINPMFRSKERSSDVSQSRESQGSRDSQGPEGRPNMFEGRRSRSTGAPTNMFEPRRNRSAGGPSDFRVEA